MTSGARQRVAGECFGGRGKRFTAGEEEGEEEEPNPNPNPLPRKNNYERGNNLPDSWWYFLTPELVDDEHGCVALSLKSGWHFNDVAQVLTSSYVGTRAN